MNSTHDVAVEAVKIAPPAVVGGAHFLGMSVPDLISVLTVIYLVGLIVHQLPKHWQGIMAIKRRVQEWRQKRD